MALTVMVDGELVPPGEAKVSVFDRGFLYGDSVFETIRTYGGRPYALAEHLARLERSAELVFISLPVNLDQLAREVVHTVEAAGHKESYVRITVTRGQGTLGLDPSLADVPLRVIIVSELSPPADSVYQEGATAITFATMRPSDATDAAGAKIGNYLVAVLAMRAAKEAGAHEAMILNAEGRIVEGATSNVFMVRGRELITPAIEAGILPGITRDRALSVAESLGLRVRYHSPTVSELQAADEVFISSSIRELVPIIELDSQPIGNHAVGKVTRQLLDAFRKLVRSEVAVGPDR